MARPALNRPGFVAALDWEAAVLRRAGARGAWRIECTGPGSSAAAAGARAALAADCGLLVSWGTAGALAGMRPGDVLVAGRVVDEGGRCRDAAEDLVAGLLRALAPAAAGTLLTVSEPVQSPERKRALRAESGADAIDMESAAVADVASAHGVPWIAIRAIVDAADVAVPDAAIAGMDGARVRAGRVCAALLESPRELGPLIALARSARRARRALATAARRLAEHGVDGLP